MKTKEVTTMDFPAAMESLLYDRSRVARAAWKGKNWVAISGPEGNLLPASGFWNEHSKKMAEENGGQAIVKPYINFKTEDNAIQMGWSPSNQDIFAQDWYLVVD